MLSAHRRVNNTNRLHRLFIAVSACVLIGGCAATGALTRGRDAERRQDFDIAVVEYAKAVRLRPNDTTARLSLERAKLRASQEHFIRGRRLAAMGKIDEALVEYEMAAEMNPV